jgi:hypothetical protein
MDMQDFKSKVECLPQLHRGLQSRPTGLWSPCRSWKVYMSWMSWCILAWGQGGLSKYNQWDTGQAWTAARSEAFVCESDPSYFRRIWPTHKSLLLDEVHASLVSHWFEIIPKRYRQDHWGQLISSQEINQTLHPPLPLSPTNRNQRVCSFRVSHKNKNRHH